MNGKQKSLAIAALVLAALLLAVMVWQVALPQPLGPRLNAQGAYAYPLTPDMEEWAELLSLEEMIEACRVPQDLLAELDAPALLETALSHPLIVNVLAFNFYAWGVDSILSYNDALAVLWARSDAPAVLAEAYLALEPADEPVFEDEEAAGQDEEFDTDQVMRRWCLEILLAQPAIYDHLSDETRAAIAAHAQGWANGSYFERARAEYE